MSYVLEYAGDAMTMEATRYPAIIRASSHTHGENGFTVAVVPARKTGEDNDTVDQVNTGVL